MPSIILGIHFESELGNYFEKAYAWHNCTGPHHTRSGFRMMEIHDLYFDFELPWWSEVNDEPSNHMPKTMAYLNENFDGEELEMFQTLIKRGLKAGRDELIKITKRYLLKVPILLLVLCNRKRGAPFLRAVLSVLHEYVENNISTEEPIDVMFIHDADTANSDDPKWGKYIYADPNNRPENEKIWYDLLTKSKENIDDLVHFWQQLCLNWRVLTDDLQRLSKVTSVSDMAGGEGAPLNAFQTEYPILFECLDAVFGTMMSNSRLCEQIHGMMRFGLRSAIGMDQADHQRMYNTSTDYEMKEERRKMVSDSDAYRQKNKKAASHSATKQQQQRLSKQLVERSADYVDVALSVIGLDSIPTITQINEKGRRVQDNENLQKQIADEDAKASRLTRVTMTADSIKILADNTRLTNDYTFVGDALIISWREKVSQMLVQKFWKDLSPTDKFIDTFKIARESFIHIENVIKPKALELEKITSYNKAKSPIHDYIKVTKTITDKVFKFVNDMGGFDDKSVEKTDIFFLFIRPVDSLLDEESIEPVEEALVKTFNHVDSHYTYTANRGVEEHSDSEGEYNALDDDGSILGNMDTA